MKAEELKRLKDEREAILLTDRLIQEEQAKRVVQRLENEDAQIHEQAYLITLEKRNRKKEIRKIKFKKIIRKALPYIISGAIGLGVVGSVYAVNKGEIDKKVAINGLEKEINLHGG